MDRIEARVLTRSRDVFDTPELMTEFTKALAAERRKLERQSGSVDIDRLKHKIAADEKARDNIMSAIEVGAQWESFGARWDAIGEAIAETTDRIRIGRARGQRRGKGAPDSRGGMGDRNREPGSSAR